MPEFSPGGFRRFVVWYAAGHVEGYLSVENSIFEKWTCTLNTKRAWRNKVGSKLNLVLTLEYKMSESGTMAKLKRVSPCSW